MYTCYLPGRLSEGLYKAFDFLAMRVVILLVEARVAKRTIHIQPIRELKIKKPKHENLIFFLNLDITPTSPTFDKLDEMK